jgi:hypothetical protein
MSEREPVNPGPIPEQKPSRKNGFIYGGTAGIMLGAPTYIATAAAGNSEALQAGGAVFAVTTLAFAGDVAKNVSLHEAEDAKEAGNKTRERLKIAQAVAEQSLTFALPPGITFSLLNPSAGLVAAGMGGLYSAKHTLGEWKKRTQDLPELSIPEDVHVIQSDSFPDRHNGYKLPPVFVAESIKHLKAFRELNKETIVRWAGKVPRRKELLTDVSESVPRLLTSVFVLPNVSHYPVADPEESSDMKLMDGDDYLIASPVRHSESLWSHHTIFDLGTDSIRVRDRNAWDNWKSKSWKEIVLVVAQYRDTRKNRFRIGSPSLEEIEDRYWLLDILKSHEHGSREKKPETARESREAVPIYQA